MSSVYVLPNNLMPGVWKFTMGQNQYLTLGPLVDGLTVASPVPTPVIDLTLTATLYANRIVNNPRQQGTIVSTFGSNGSLVLPHIGLGVYRAVSPYTLSAPIGTDYILVFDAPQSNSGYQYHREVSAAIILAGSATP